MPPRCSYTSIVGGCLLSHSSLELIEPTRRISLAGVACALPPKRIDLVAKRGALVTQLTVELILDCRLCTSGWLRRAGHHRLQLGSHRLDVTLRESDLFLLSRHLLLDDLDPLGVHFLILGRDLHGLAIADPLGELAPASHSLELRCFHDEPLTRLLERLAKLVQSIRACTRVSFMRDATIRRSSGFVARLSNSSNDRRKPSNAMGLLVLKEGGVYDTGRVISHATASEAMTHVPLVIVTGTTEVIRSIPRIRVNEAYANALVEAGLIPVILPPIDAVAAVAALKDVAGLVLTGGEDVDPMLFGETPHPETGAPHHRRDAYELALAHAALELRVPTLAICRGAQVVNVALGGSLVQDIPSQRPGPVAHDPAGRRTERVHRIEIDPDSRLARDVGATSIATNSSHHQSVDRVAAGLRVTARSEDGIIEALESTDPEWWMVAVQWHPEELTGTAESWDRRLFTAFGDAVRANGRD